MTALDGWVGITPYSLRSAWNTLFVGAQLTLTASVPGGCSCVAQS